MRRQIVALIILVGLVGFLIGLWMPRTILPGDFSLHLPSSCAETIGRAQRLVHASTPHEVSQLRHLANERPDCFSPSDRRLLRR